MAANALGYRDQLDQQLVLPTWRRAGRSSALRRDERVIGFVHIGSFAGHCARTAAA